MHVKNKNVKEILETYKEISLLGKVSALLSWDTNVNLPEKGATERGEQNAYITKLISGKWLDKDFRSSVENCNTDRLTIYEKAIIRNVKHAGKYYWKVPQKTIVEISHVTSDAFMAWQKARRENKFKDFLPHLVKVIELNRQIAEHLGYKDHPYDALLDLYEPDLTTKRVKDIFAILQPALTELLKKITKSNIYISVQELFPKGEYSVTDQERITHFVLNKIGYDLASGRQDVSPHPFTETMGSSDVRITNRYKDSNFVESIMVAMHEGGHALYEQGVDPAYAGTPLEGGISLGIHESQSRFWENQIGRSKEFIQYLAPTLKKFYKAQLGNVSSEDLYKIFNKVTPSLIRVEADEVTYNLHIALRFEIEEGLINGNLKAADLPDIWNDKMKKYLGISPKNDSDGVLQDVHWSYGSIGYFPTYTLGNLYAAQITNTLNKSLKISGLAKKGNLKPILEWLRNNIHRYGSLYLPDELIKKATGEELDSKYFLGYLNSKYAKIYSLK